MFKIIKARRAAKIEARRVYDLIAAETMRRFVAATQVEQYGALRQQVEMEYGVAIGKHRP